MQRPDERTTFRCRFTPVLALCIVAALLSCGSALRAATTTATIIIGGRPVPLLVSPFVGGDGQVYAPVDVLHLLGATYTVDSRGSTVLISGADGRQVTQPYTPVQGRLFIPLQPAVIGLGASADWQPTTTTLTIRARLEMVRQSGGELAIYTSYPVYYQVQHIEHPNRIYVDVFGLDLAAAPASVPVEDTDGTSAVSRIRTGQMNYDTVRVTIDLNKDMAFQVSSSVQTDRIKVGLGNAIDSSQHVASAGVDHSPGSGLAPLGISPSSPGVRPLPTNPGNVINPPTPVLPQVASGTGVRITGINVLPVTATLTQIAVSTTGPAKYRTETLRDPNRLAFDLAGAELDAGVNPSLPGAGSVIKAVRAGILHAGVTSFGRVVIDLSRLVGFTVTSQRADDGTMTYLISLQTPRQIALTGDNSLAGKTVVVDPGHGHQDSGSLGTDGTMEKDMALAISLRLRDTLAADGANVVMTRADDSFLPVDARPQLAVTHHADYFISVHCDSSGARNSHTGSTVFFHAQNDLCRRMASDIVTRVSEVSGIPSDGVKSDTIRFQTGFGVLRGAPMPAVLVECGYMNNDQDLAKLKDPATQQHIAEGIAAGLRDFIADRTAP